MHATDIIGYVYEADHHCTECALARFGAEPGRSWVKEGAEDSEGNEVHPLFASDEWFEIDDQCERLSCGDCRAEIDTAHASECVENAGESPCTLVERERGYAAGVSLDEWQRLVRRS